MKKEKLAKMNKLRLCPNCQGEVHILPAGDYHKVICEDCGTYVQGDTYENAVALWNWSCGLYEKKED